MVVGLIKTSVKIRSDGENSLGFGDLDEDDLASALHAYLGPHDGGSPLVSFEDLHLLVLASSEALDFDVYFVAVPEIGTQLIILWIGCVTSPHSQE